MTIINNAKPPVIPIIPTANLGRIESTSFVRAPSEDSGPGRFEGLGMYDGLNWFAAGVTA